jgi:hypothetical protein
MSIEGDIKPTDRGLSGHKLYHSRPRNRRPWAAEPNRDGQYSYISPLRTAGETGGDLFPLLLFPYFSSLTSLPLLLFPYFSSLTSLPLLLFPYFTANGSADLHLRPAVPIPIKVNKLRPLSIKIALLHLNHHRTLPCTWRFECPHPLPRQLCRASHSFRNQFSKSTASTASSTLGFVRPLASSNAFG